MGNKMQGVGCGGHDVAGEILAWCVPSEVAAAERELRVLGVLVCARRESWACVWVWVMTRIEGLVTSLM